jgi:putative phage-type endonuclease
MRELKLTQGSAEWAAHRAKSRNASDAPALMGESPYVSRAELIRRRATGVERERADAEFILQRGHAVEPALRAYAERIIGEDLFPVVAVSDDGYLSASFDGVSMDGRIIFEGKQKNAPKMNDVRDGRIPDVDYWQIVHQFAVNESANVCIYAVGDGSDDGTVHLEVRREDIAEDIPKLISAWRQFDSDVAAYVPEPVKTEVVAKHVDGFGALMLRVEGRVLACNLDDFKRGAEAFIARLPKPSELQTDQDFADAEAAVKACAEAEARIKAAKEAALAQMADVDAVLRAADSVAETIRSARLALDKAVKTEKENRRAQMVRGGEQKVLAYYSLVNQTMPGYEMAAPATLTADIGAAIKGLKSLDSIRDKIDAAVAQAKVAASLEADRRRLCIAVIERYKEHRALIPDAAALVASKSPEDLRNLIEARIAEAARAAQEREARAAQEREAQAAAQRILTGMPTQIEGAREPVPSVGTIKIGEINAMIQPLSISAAGMSALGITPVARQRAAILYSVDDMPRLLGKLSEIIARAQALHRQQMAA